MDAKTYVLELDAEQLTLLRELLLSPDVAAWWQAHYEPIQRLVAALDNLRNWS
ncbi:MAG TPA: hypothetical protein VKQ30_24960 [Ktedonobacterales bacterium]|nr:hypothetical protein [Ktedonobacterales bacterium]